MSSNYVQAFFIALSLCLSLSSALQAQMWPTQDKVVQRILNGNDAASGQHPWVVSLRLDNVHVCMGAIITRRHILTAGHCVSTGDSKAVDPSRVSFRVGAINQYAGGYIVGARGISIQGDYANFLHDLALVELQTNLEFDDKVDKINLQPEETPVAPGTTLTVTGWGLNEDGNAPHRLKETTMELMSDQECETAAGYGFKSVLCLKHPAGKGVCRGDAGAPVVADGRLVGVVSFAFGNCGSQYPDIATNVAHYNSWINAAIA